MGPSSLSQRSAQPATSHIHTPNFQNNVCRDFTRKYKVLKPLVKEKEWTKMTVETNSEYAYLYCDTIPAVIALFFSSGSYYATHWLSMEVHSNHYW